MGTLWILVAVYALIAFGLLLCFVGKFPGQVLAYAGMLAAYFGLHVHYPIWLMVLCGVLVIASIVVNKKVVPIVAGKVYAFDKAGIKGTVWGSLFAIVCITAVESDALIIVFLAVMPYVFAFIFEFVAVRNAIEAAKRAGGAYTIFAVSTLINVAICAICFIAVIRGPEYEAEEVVENVAEVAGEVAKESVAFSGFSSSKAMASDVAQAADAFEEEYEEPADEPNEEEYEEPADVPNDSALILYETMCSRKLEESDLDGLTSPDLRILRNEIFARHGYIFKSQDLKDYFSEFDWYEPKYSDVSGQLNSFERYNVDFIKRHE